MGLVDECVEGPDVLPEARKLAAEIASVSQWSVRATKTMMQGFREGRGAESAEAEALFVEGFANPDFAEGVSAFLAKRRPDWKVP